MVETPAVTLPVRCRPDQSNWIVAALLGLFGIMGALIPWLDARSQHPDPNPKGLWVLAVMYILVFLMPAVVGAVWLCRARIIADVGGLRWRSLGRWHSARWDEVTDYYERLPQKRSSPLSSIIETGTTKLKFDEAWRNSEALRSALTTCAVNARIKEWGILGTRPEDEWPHVFEYQAQKPLLELGFVALFLVSLLILLSWQLVPDILKRYEQGDILWNVLPMMVSLLLDIAAIAAVIILLTNYHNSMTRRLNQCIVVDTGGITYKKGDENATFAWEDVIDYYIRCSGQLKASTDFVVVTSHGNIEFSALLQERMLLKAIVRRYATAAKDKAWRYEKDPNALGGVAAKWSGGHAGIGERVFGYRTRTHRALLWYLATFASAPALVAGLNAILGLSGFGSSGFPWSITLLLNALFFWCLWRYQSARIQIGVRGVTQKVLSGGRFIAWEDVQDYFLSGDGEIYLFGNVVGINGSRIRFWTSIADVEELQEEIARRAVRCQHQPWEKKERRAGLVKR